MKLVYKTSPNHSERPPGTTVDCIVLHSTASSSARNDVDWCCRAESKVSYHAIIDRDGTIYRLVDTVERAWHAGVSIFDGRGNVNNFSVGLAFANKNDGVDPYTDEQYQAAADLINDWVKLYPAITKGRITTHAAIARPLGRKTDPKGFDKERLLSLVTIEAREKEAPDR